MDVKSKRLISEAIAEAQKLSKYSIGETIEGLAIKLGVKPSEILKLNSNENFFIPLDFLRNILRQVVDETDPRLYPRDEFRELKEALSQRLNILPEEIVIGAGSDQLIDLVSRMFLSRGDEALSINPTFVIYERCVRIQKAEYKSVPLKDDFSLDVDALISSVNPKTKIIFLCSPNNPTGNRFSREDILRIAENFNGLVVVDEAYADFASETLIDLAGELENLIVFRTFSKFFGLAGLRVGYAITNRDLAKTINERFQMPFSASIIALKMATKLLEEENFKFIEEKALELKVERSRLIKALNNIEGVKAFPSETSFILFHIEDISSPSVYKALLKRGVIIREIGKVLKFKNCLRVTVAPAEMMKRFLKSLEEVLDELRA
ncbi:histidinol-phosphate transaminase [Candidatus Bathyarchaeota archaeon]|nr:histidinol-phosphate transaminase [Candidatus Bathyarchaeota archaeon]